MINILLKDKNGVEVSNGDILKIVSIKKEFQEEFDPYFKFNVEVNIDWEEITINPQQDLDNLGGNLRGWEQKGRFYFQNEKPYRTVIERELTGTQTRLENLTQYSDLFVTIEGSNKAGINDKEYTYITYHILVPYGRTS